MPGIDNLLIVIANYRLYVAKLLPAQIVIVGKFDSWLQPKLRFAIPTVGVNVNARLLTREEEQAIAVLAKDRGAQVPPPT
jgi:hypothetical protein